MSTVKKQESLEVPKDAVQIIFQSYAPILSNWADKIQQLEAEAINLVISSSNQEGAAIDLGKKTKGIRDQAEDLHKTTVGPAKDILKKIDIAFGFVTVRADSVIKTIKDKIIQFRTNENRRLEEEKKKQEEAYKKKLLAARAQGKKLPALLVFPDIIPDHNIIGKDSSAQIREVWTFEVTDAEALPEVYKMPNEKALKAAVQSGIRKINGCRIYQKPDIAIS